jgi:hypothetical protein
MELLINIHLFHSLNHELSSEFIEMLDLFFDLHVLTSLLIQENTVSYFS